MYCKKDVLKNFANFKRGHHPVGIYMFKVDNRNTRTRCEMCSKLTIKTPCSSVSVVNFKQVNADWAVESLFNKVVGLKAYNVIQKRLPQVFSVKFAKFLRILILKNNCEHCF